MYLSLYIQYIYISLLVLYFTSLQVGLFRQNNLAKEKHYANTVKQRQAYVDLYLPPKQDWC